MAEKFLKGEHIFRTKEPKTVHYRTSSFKSSFERDIRALEVCEWLKGNGHLYVPESHEIVERPTWVVIDHHGKYFVFDREYLSSMELTRKIINQEGNPGSGTLWADSLVELRVEYSPHQESKSHDVAGVPQGLLKILGEQGFRRISS